MSNIIWNEDFKEYIKDKGDYISVYSEGIETNYNGQYSLKEYLDTTKIIDDNLLMLSKLNFKVIHFTSTYGNGELDLSIFNKSNVKIIILDVTPIFDNFTRTDIKIIINTIFYGDDKSKLKEYKKYEYVKCKDIRCDELNEIKKTYDIN